MKTIVKCLLVNVIVIINLIYKSFIYSFSLCQFHVEKSETVVQARQARLSSQQSRFPRGSQRQSEVHFTFKSALIFQIFKTFSILVVVIVTIMEDKIGKKNTAENSTEVSYKTPSDFHSPSNRHELQSSTVQSAHVFQISFKNLSKTGQSHGKFC